MITLKINPENYLVHHEGIGDDLMLKVEPKTFGVRITLCTTESSMRDEKTEDGKNDALLGLLQQANSLVPALLGMRPPCEGCGDKRPILAIHPDEFQVQSEDGTGVTFPPGIYAWHPGKLPVHLRDIPEGDDSGPH